MNGGPAFADEWVRLDFTLEEARQLVVGSALAVVLATRPTRDELDAVLAGDGVVDELPWPGCAIRAAHQILLEAITSAGYARLADDEIAGIGSWALQTGAAEP